MFDRDRFVAECRDAVATDRSHKAAREVMIRAISEPAAVLRRTSKEPRRLMAPIAPLFRDLDQDAERILGRN